jgi:hypothetical protein
MQPIEGSLIGSLVEIIQDCQDRVFRAYRETIGGDEADIPPIVSMEPLTVLPSPEHEIDLSRESLLDQDYHPTEFLDAIFRPAPHQSPEQYEPDLRELEPPDCIPLVDNAFSDSGYGASEQHCNCQGPCTCLGTTTSSQGRDIYESEFYVPEEIEGSNRDVQLHDWALCSPWNPQDHIETGFALSQRD